MARRAEAAVYCDVANRFLRELQELYASVDYAGGVQEVVHGLSGRLFEQTAQVFVRYPCLGGDIGYGERFHVALFDYGDGSIDDWVGVVSADVLNLTDMF